MPALTGPLFSLGARGTLRKTLVYSRWRGVQYARSHVIPANPDTAAQQAQRQTFRNIALYWDYAGTRARAPWTARATGQPFTNRNLLLKQNVEAMYGDTDIANFVGSPGAGGAPPPTISSVTNGVGQVTVNITAPTAPTGWTITEAVAIFIKNFDPTTLQSSVITGEGFDATSPYAAVITGLPAGAGQVRAWLEWLKPDGTTAYSTAASSTGTPT